jgi:hypothetical protein
LAKRSLLFEKNCFLSVIEALLGEIKYSELHCRISVLGKVTGDAKMHHFYEY